jgi:putative inorganic carbon (HCO3(-)) transporter
LPGTDAPSTQRPVRALSTRLIDAGVYGFAALVPISIAGAQGAMGLVAFGWLLLLVSGGREARRLRPDPILPFLVLFLLAKVVSAVLSPAASESLRDIRGDWTILFVPLLNQVISSLARAWRLLLVFVAASSVSGLYGVLQSILGVDYVRDRGLEPMGGIFVATGFFGHHLTYGGLVLLGIVAAFALALHGPRGTTRWGLVSTVLLAGGLVASVARTAWAGSVAGMGVLVATGGRRALVRIGILVLALAVVLALRPEVRVRASSAFDLASDPRMPLWKTSLAMARDAPLFGMGSGAFRRVFQEYRVPGEYQNTGHPHNDLLNQLVQGGVIGTIVWLAIWARLFVLLGRAWRRLRGASPPGTPARAFEDHARRRTLVLTSAACTFGFLVGGLGQCFFTDEEVIMGEWLLVVLGLVAARTPVAEGSPTPLSIRS